VRLPARAAAILAAAAAVTGLTFSTAHAASGNQICYSNPIGQHYACLNAWNGGPFVKVYTLGAGNNDFTMINLGGGNVGLEDSGDNPWASNCVGDAYNDQNHADTSLDACGSGWGTNFTTSTSGCPAGWIAFHNNHWNAWLGPPDSYGNGSPFYLNKPNKICFEFFGTA
jgi:hypothetical protein